MAGEPAGRHPPLPASLGKYRIEALLGRGGMGEVYKAYDPSLDRIVALKTIRPEVQDDMLLGRFKREGRAAGRLRHPRIVTVYDLGDVDGTAFMAMEYLEGRSLAAEIREGRLTFEARMRILLEVLDGLAYAHQNGVVHRDIKPANIQVLPDSSVKILDFGVARLAAAESLSHTGTVVGTVLYMAPEQLRGEKVDGRADVYSAGVVAYELFAERRPFEGQTLTEIVLKVINEPPPPMNSPWLIDHPQLEEIVRRAIAKHPSERYATAAAMAADMEQAVGAAGAPLATTAPSVVGPEISTVISPPPSSTLVPGSISPRSPDGVWRSGWGRIAGVSVLAVTVSVAGGVLARLARGQWSPSPGSSTAASVGDSAPPPTLPPREPRGDPTLPTPPPTTETTIAEPRPSPIARARNHSSGRGIAVTGDRHLASTVAAVLRSRGCLVVDAPAEAAFVVRVDWNVDLRPAPLGTGAAKTADYAGAVEVRGPGVRGVRRDVDGHVMEVGESVTLAAARREFARQVAEAIAPGIEPCRP